jgi:hypothetical protein
MTTELWPPLGLIRRAFERDGRPSADAPPAGPPGALPAQPGGRRAAGELLMPLTELAARRAAVAARAFPARWAPGRLVSVLHEGVLLGVLLDECLQGDLWRGWMAAGETDWAGAFDVLLEPGDEPFEPMFGLVQTWNVLTLARSPQLCPRVLGEVSATRLAAIRAVHAEWAAQRTPAIAPEPGRIALRSVGGHFTVLSGTPLGEPDPRSEYQRLYRGAALRLGAARAPSPAAAVAEDAVRPRGAAPAKGRDGGWGRVRRWFAADRLVRPAFAVLALVVAVQNIGLIGFDAEEGEEVRFRSVPPAAPAPAPADLALRWRPGVSIEASAALLRSVSAQVVGGPDAQGVWLLHLPDPVGDLATLSASPLVASVEPL